MFTVMGRFLCLKRLCCFDGDENWKLNCYIKPSRFVLMFPFREILGYWETQTSIRSCLSITRLV